MENFKTLSKGAYPLRTPQNFVGVSSYIFAESGGKKYLLLKLKNSRAENVGKINLRITQLNEDGEEIGVSRVSSDKGGGANSSFAFGEKIEADSACCGFIAEIESAVYGGKLLKSGENGVEEIGAADGGKRGPEAAIPSLRGKTRAVADRRLGVSAAVVVLTCLLLVCAALVTYFRLKDFMQNAAGFTYSGVEYIFEDESKAEGSDIIVTGYNGSRSNVLIPEKIDGYTVSEIRESAFAGNGKIKRLKIEGDVKIGGYAFADCKKLVSVSMDKVTDVGGYAFGGCKALASLEISGGGEIALGEYAFKDCAALERVKIQKQTVYPGNAAVFSGDGNIRELYLENYGGELGALFDGAAQSLESLTVCYLDGICDNFCYGFSALGRADIAYIYGDGFGIGDNAFRNTSLEILNLPEGLVSVGASAFENCLLAQFNADGIESMGACAFKDCAKLRDFTVPASLTEIRESAFAGCISLESVIFESDETLQSIGDEAFAFCPITGITLPDSVRYMGSRMFYGCDNLKTLIMPYLGSTPDNLANLDYFFGGGAAVESFTLTCAEYLPALAFYLCFNLKEVNLNDGIKRIGEGAFYGCSRIKSLVIPQSVQAVDGNPFDGCFRLYEIYNLSGADISCGYSLAVYSSLSQSMPKSECDGYTAAFTDGNFSKPAGWYLIDCPDGIELSLPGSFAGVNGYAIPDYLFYRESVTDIAIPDAVNGIGKNAFYLCEALENVSISPSAPVREIPEKAFYGCKALSSVALPVSVQTVGGYAFYGCEKLVSAEFFDRIVKIGDNAFSKCYRLEKVRIPNKSAAEIGGYAFGSCRSLQSVYIGGGVTEIGEGAFSGDILLSSAEIASAAGAFGAFAFYGCNSLSEIAVPYGVTAIGESAFCGCGSLRKISLPVTLSSIGHDAFTGCNKLRAVANYSSLNIGNNENYGGAGKLAVFIVTDYADSAQLTFTERDGVTFLSLRNDYFAVWCDGGVKSLNLSSPAAKAVLRVAPYAFENNTKIAAADLSGVTAVGESAFYGCAALKKATAGGALTEIGKNAFAKCSGLSEINLQDTKLSALGESAFTGCTSLLRAAFPESLNKIPARAFYRCLSLADAVIPANVTSVGDEAFYGCTALLQVHNLSRLSMKAGANGNGYCAFYALYVFTDAVSEMLFAEKNGYKFANYAGSWYLYSCVNNEYYKKLPESFVYGNSAVTSYIIRAGALNSQPYPIIPASVSAIESGGITSPLAIYYLGTPDGWKAVRPASLGGATVYYYSQCIHADGESLWTYDSSGNPTTAQTSLVWTKKTDPTCAEDGEREGRCKTCGLTESESIEKLYHSANSGGECKRCGAQGEFILALNQSAESYSVSGSNFSADGKTFISTNPGYSYAKITVTAKQDIQINLSGYLSSSYGGSATVSAAGKTVAEISSPYENEITVSLSKGESLVISYYKTGYTGSAVTIGYILIFA